MIYHSWSFDYYCSIQWARNPSSAPRSTSWSGRKITAASLPSLAMHCTARWKMRSVAIGKSKLCASITAELRQDPCHLWSEAFFFVLTNHSLLFFTHLIMSSCARSRGANQTVRPLCGSLDHLARTARLMQAGILVRLEVWSLEFAERFHAQLGVIYPDW